MCITFIYSWDEESAQGHRVCKHTELVGHHKCGLPRGPGSGGTTCPGPHFIDLGYPGYDCKACLRLEEKAHSIQMNKRRVDEYRNFIDDGTSYIEPTLLTGTAIPEGPLLGTNRPHESKFIPLMPEKAKTRSQLPANPSPETFTQYYHKICKFWAKGFCKKGGECKFLHPSNDPSRYRSNLDSSKDDPAVMATEGEQGQEQQQEQPNVAPQSNPTTEKPPIPLDVWEKMYVSICVGGHPASEEEILRWREQQRWLARRGLQDSIDRGVWEMLQPWIQSQKSNQYRLGHMPAASWSGNRTYQQWQEGRTQPHSDLRSVGETMTAASSASSIPSEFEVRERQRAHFAPSISLRRPLLRRAHERAVSEPKNIGVYPLQLPGEEAKGHSSCTYEDILKSAAVYSQEGSRPRGNSLRDSTPESAMLEQGMQKKEGGEESGPARYVPPHKRPGYRRSN
ncbi:MAG: hypothetical protein M1820_005592 [Bogoriella megaspora]|nr:MAG: hypothetical protein M1820_005592 [Bogoriella megaspora]